jgi:hypothetical protein
VPDSTLPRSAHGSTRVASAQIVAVSETMQVDFGAESEHSLHLSSHGHFEHSTHSSPAFSPFRHPAVCASMSNRASELR